jgi:tungstate transport system permease protein
MWEIIEGLLAIKEDLIQIIFLSLSVSSLAVIIGMVLGIPIGALIGLFSFPGRRFLIAVIYTLMGFPTVLIGVLVYMMLSRHGILGDFTWLFTPKAMVMAQSFLTTPIIMGLTMSAVYSKEKVLTETAQSLGATRWQMILVLLREAKKGIWIGVATAFGRAISEVGAVMLVGGNIEGSTRVLTTAIILETRKGNLDAALVLGFVLLLISFIVQAFLMMGMMELYQRGSKQEIL